MGAGLLPAAQEPQDQRKENARQPAGHLDRPMHQAIGGDLALRLDALDRLVAEFRRELKVAAESLSRLRWR